MTQSPTIRSVPSVSGKALPPRAGGNWGDTVSTRVAPFSIRQPTQDMQADVSHANEAAVRLLPAARTDPAIERFSLAAPGPFPFVQVNHVTHSKASCSDTTETSAT